MAAETRARLLDAAVGLLIDEGRAGVTTGRLTQHAGVVQSAFYNHFSSVDECVQAALIEVRRQVMTTADMIFGALQGPEYTTTGRVEGLLLQVFEQAATEPALYRLLVQRHHEPDVASVIEGVLDALRTHIIDTILHEDARTNSLSQAEASAAASLTVGVFLAGLEQVLDEANPQLVARACATFVTNGVFALAGVDDASPESASP